MDMLQLLRELSTLRGVSGDEAHVQKYILTKIQGHAQTQTDALGNIIAFKKGVATPQKKIQISAHMDEVGFIITALEEDGLLRFSTVGGVDVAVSAGKPVQVGDSALPGVIGVKPTHLLEEEERNAFPKMEALAIDIGAKNRDEASKHVRVGDYVTFAGDFMEFGDGLIGARALDDRAGCAMMMELICGEMLPFDCTFTFTVQEENGCIGAKTAAWTVAPDIGIALETTTAGDIAGVEEYKKVCRLGEGPVLSFMDKGTIYAPALYQAALASAVEKGMRCQSKQGVFGGNESRSIQTTRAGAQMLAVSLPCRYLHSPCCVLNLRDIEDTMRLLPVWIERFGNL